jgi:hypothetical protein
MNTNHQDNSGVKLLVNKLRGQFKIAENINYYSEENYKIAERKYLKYALRTGDFKDSSR